MKWSRKSPGLQDSSELFDGTLRVAFALHRSKAASAWLPESKVPSEKPNAPCLPISDIVFVGIYSIYIHIYVCIYMYIYMHVIVYINSIVYIYQHIPKWIEGTPMAGLFIVEKPINNRWLGGTPFQEPPCDPLIGYIYLHLPYKSPSFVGNYSSPMEHLGNCDLANTRNVVKL